MIPVALALGSGMESNQGMGIVIVFGLTIGTLVTLVFIPVLYSLCNGIGRGIKKFFVRRKLKERERIANA
jgi:HAE1 family hydrophobic/amphiphilic exporter-1